MAWTAPLTATLNGTLTAAQFNSNVRNNLLETEVAKATGKVTQTPVTTAIKVWTRRRRGHHRYRCGYQSKIVYVTTGGWKRKTHMMSTAANAIAERESAHVNVEKQETTGSTSYTDLKTTGPSITITTGTAALVFWSCMVWNSSAGQACYSSVAVSGASTVSASDDWCVLMNGINAFDAPVRGSFHLFTGLTAGSNTFTQKYKVTGGTGTFDYRHMSVVAL